MCLSIAIHYPENVLSKGEHEGFEWVTVHNNIGFRCGYVRVPLGHPWHGKGYENINAKVHGGLTFAEPDEDCGKGEDNAWWVGFDCAHYGDAPDPSLSNSEKIFRSWGFGTIRDQEYVEKECRDLCNQAALATYEENN